MLAYAASRPVAVDRRPHPSTMLMIIGVHVAVIAAVMSAKMDLPHRIFDPPPKVFWVPNPKVPPPNPVHTSTRTQPTNSWIDHSRVQQIATDPQVVTGTTKLDPDPGRDALVIPEVKQPPIRVAVSTGAQLLTPSSELKPPYPASKLLTEEEAVLKLRLTIDEHGRVVAVDPVGRADPAFLEAARRHLLAHWRYKPAMDDGRAVTSSE